MVESVSDGEGWAVSRAGMVAAAREGGGGGVGSSVIDAFEGQNPTRCAANPPSTGVPCTGDPDPICPDPICLSSAALLDNSEDKAAVWGGGWGGEGEGGGAAVGWEHDLPSAAVAHTLSPVSTGAHRRVTGNGRGEVVSQGRGRSGGGVAEGGGTQSWWQALILIAESKACRLLVCQKRPKNRSNKEHKRPTDSRVGCWCVKVYMYRER